MTPGARLRVHLSCFAENVENHSHNSHISDHKQAGNHCVCHGATARRFVKITQMHCAPINSQLRKLRAETQIAFYEGRILKASENVKIQRT